MEGLRVLFADLEDPRSGNAQRHDLLEIVTVALCAVLCGAQSCTDMARFGELKLALLRRFLRLDAGVPSHDTFSRLFRLLEPEAFARCFGRFVEAFTTANPAVIAVDGKSLRGAVERARGGTPLNLISAWAADQRLVLAQTAVPAGGEEILAVPQLLAMLDLAGRVVSADAMHCQAETARQIIARGGDYVLALKDNQPSLHADVRLLLDDPQAPPDSVHESVDGDHRRIETRRAEVLHDVGWLADSHGWPGLAAVGKITASREIGGRSTTAIRYYLLSKPFSAARFAAIARGHWGIENQLHWVLDVVMDEDHARNRKDHAAANLAALRRLALNLVRTYPDKSPIRARFQRAAWDEDFLIKLLQPPQVR